MNCSKNSILDLLHLFLLFTWAVPRIYPYAPPLIKHLVLRRKVELTWELITMIQVWPGVNNSRAPNYCGEAEKSQQCHKYFLRYSRLHLLPKHIRFEHGDAKIAFFPGRHSLVSLLGLVGLTANRKPTLPSHKSLMGINSRWVMLHENVKFYFKVTYPIKAHYNTRQIFPVSVD